MSVYMQNPVLIYAIAFFIFLALAFKYGRKPLLAYLDAEINAIRHALDEARRLHAEAEATLADCKAKQKAAEADAVAIVAQARQQVAQMRQQAARDMAEALKRNENLAAERIRIAETDAVAAVRAAAIGLAMEIARKTIAQNLDAAELARLADQAIAEIPVLQAGQAKAA